ncbi:hepatic lectin-like [Patiria miniata]|uniref:C-type lectin domain-containing protein n=1 Tax=Patiria miniata TaxID=46514 RepID=A0A913ZWU1_PATMI|nr:hepatic lectin-like [Patiria miniata]
MPQSQEETEYLRENLSIWFWIDCNDLEGSWECRDGTTDVVYTDWGRGEPNNGHREDCAVATDSGVWNDVKCEDRAPVICKRPAPQLQF